MVRNIIISFLFVALTACQAHKEPRVLTMADVHFPEPEKEAIIKNNICEIIAYDTAEIFAINPDLRSSYGKVPPSWMWDKEPYMGYPMEFIKYDTAGNRIFEFRKRAFGLMCGFGIYPHSVYDSLGFLSYNWKKETTYWGETFFYFFLPAERRFGKVHGSSRHRAGEYDTTTYLLNERGQPVFGSHYERFLRDTGWEYYFRDSIWYRYTANHLAEIEVHITYADDVDYDKVIRTRYYYTNEHLDSMIHTEKYPHNRWSFPDATDKVYYDSLGLPYKGIIADSIHVYYLIKKCGDTTIGNYNNW